MKKTTHRNSLTEPAHYFALVSGHIVALSVAIVFGLTIYAETDPVFKRTMAFMFMPVVGDVQTQTANAFSAVGSFFNN
jgi:hypothetical protein